MAELSDAQKALIQKVAQQVHSEKSQGRTKDEIINQLSAEGLDKEFVTGIVQAVFESKPKKSFLNSVLVWVILLVVYAGINGLMYIGQELYYRKDVQECEKIKKQMEESHALIDRAEQFVKNRIKQKKDIESLQVKLNDPKKYYSSESLYDIDFKKYETSLANYNSEVPKAGAMIDNYDSLINQYNSQVEQYNVLAKTAYRRWYLIPMPKGSTNSAAKRTGIH